MDTLIEPKVAEVVRVVLEHSILENLADGSCMCVFEVFVALEQVKCAEVWDGCKA